MKKSKIYGFEVTDKQDGKLIRWFSTSGKVTILCTEDLLKMYARQKMMSNIYEAYDHCKESASDAKMKFRTLTESDWNSTPNPFGKFLKKILKWK